MERIYYQISGGSLNWKGIYHQINRDITVWEREISSGKWGYHRIRKRYIRLMGISLKWWGYVIIYHEMGGDADKIIEIRPKRRGYEI